MRDCRFHLVDIYDRIPSRLSSTSISDPSEFAISQNEHLAQVSPIFTNLHRSHHPTMSTPLRTSCKLLSVSKDPGRDTGSGCIYLAVNCCRREIGVPAFGFGQLHGNTVISVECFSASCRMAQSLSNSF
jgi:hypothetical protein